MVDADDANKVHKSQVTYADIKTGLSFDIPNEVISRRLQILLDNIHTYKHLDKHFLDSSKKNIPSKYNFKMIKPSATQT